MPLIPIDSLDDPRLAGYRNLKERELARQGDRFIAEGEHLVKRLLASRLATESVLIADRHVTGMSPLVPESIPLYVAPAALVNQILGYKFHSGVMAVGIREPSPTIDDVMTRAPSGEPVTLVICPEIEKTDNLGALIRIAAGFGATAMILGQRCCDPFFRQSVRVSMGAAFYLPIVRSDDLARDLRLLHERHDVELVATVLDADAQRLEAVRRPRRLGILLGNEAQGLGREWIELCQWRVTIPMRLGTDSLNVAVAAGIFLWHFTR
ncbi:MAG TPA: RNA methyltransferase [Tepidisphaeraceae bacterium]